MGPLHQRNSYFQLKSRNDLEGEPNRGISSRGDLEDPDLFTQPTLLKRASIKTGPGEVDLSSPLKLHHSKIMHLRVQY